MKTTISTTKTIRPDPAAAFACLTFWQEGEATTYFGVHRWALEEMAYPDGICVTLLHVLVDSMERSGPFACEVGPSGPLYLAASDHCGRRLHTISAPRSLLTAARFAYASASPFGKCYLTFLLSRPHVEDRSGAY